MLCFCLNKLYCVTILAEIDGICMNLLSHIWDDM